MGKTGVEHRKSLFKKIVHLHFFVVVDSDTSFHKIKTNYLSWRIVICILGDKVVVMVGAYKSPDNFFLDVTSILLIFFKRLKLRNNDMHACCHVYCSFVCLFACLSVRTN